MEKRNILISGVTGNLGRAIAKRFHDAGDQVYGIAGSGHPSGLDLSGYYQVDLIDTNTASIAVQKILSDLNKIDVLISTIGGFASGNVSSVTGRSLLEMFSLNLFATANLVIPVFNRMVEQEGGRVFLTGAKSALSASSRAGAVAYGISKSAVFELADSMNHDGEKHNVVTSVVVPSIIDTPQNRKSMPDADFKKWVKPSDIASVIFYHCSEEAGIMRQSVIKVYGRS